MIFISALIGLLILIISITIHEFAHAYSADYLGDPTAKLAGRLTLNPIPHIDPIGTILLPLMMMISGTGMLFGWAKPTPVDPFNFRNPKRDSAIVSVAGPISNLILAFICSLLLRFLPLDYWIIGLLDSLIKTNVILAVFNLIPIHPLDGFQVVAGLLPKKYYEDWLSLTPYGMIFLIMLIFPFFGTAPINYILSPIVNFILSIFLPVKGISSGII